MKTSVLALFCVILVIDFSVGIENTDIETNEISNYNKLSTINFIVDIILRRYTEDLVKTGRTKVQVPGFEETFSQKILSLHIEEAVVVDDGWCSNISTIHRTGDAEMERIDNSIILTAHLGLKDLKIDYNNYEISFLDIHQKGNIQVDVGDNSVWLKLRAQLRPHCIIALTDMKIEELDNISVNISNLGIFDNMTHDLISWVANEVTKWYRGYVERTIFPELANIVKKADLCKYLHPFNV